MDYRIKRFFNKLRQKLTAKPLGDGLFFDIDTARELTYFQKSNLTNALRVIYAYFDDPREISILDLGCSGAEIKYLAPHVKRLVGINIARESLNLGFCPDNSELRLMNAEKIEFPDQAFDFVFSLNVYEHLFDPNRCLDEQLRVVKKTGYCYNRFGPIWSGPEGHHVFGDMLKKWEKQLDVGNGGYEYPEMPMIAYWGHLLFSQQEMAGYLSKKIKNRRLIDEIVNFIYLSGDINRMFFDEFERLFYGKNAQVIYSHEYKWPISSYMNKKLKRRYYHGGFDVYDYEILMRKK